LINANNKTPLQKTTTDPEQNNGNEFTEIDPKANGIDGLFLPSIIYIIEGKTEW